MRTWNLLTAPRGFLFIGDPHASSVKPSRRKDDFTTSVLDKLAQAARIATERSLVPVILGDLIHRENEQSVSLMSRLTKVLNQFPCTPYELDGNHGKHENGSVPEDIEFLFNQAGTIVLLNDPATVLRFQFGGQRVALHVAPFGTQIPYQLPRDADTINVLITHHDLAFENAYPGAEPLHEVKGCDLLVNGHMHKTAPSVVRGETTLHCPGNIEPLSVDCIDHKPAVWEWCPEQGVGLVPHYLDHVTDCFSLVGRQVAAAGAAESVQALAPSRFAALLAMSEGTGPGADPSRTDEAACLDADLDAVLADVPVSAATATLLRLLAADVSREAANTATPA